MSHALEEEIVVCLSKRCRGFLRRKMPLGYSMSLFKTMPQ